MTDKSEQDDNCANIYHKSLLYLVANAFEEKARIPLFRDGVPILGMQKFLAKDVDVQAKVKSGQIDIVYSPNDQNLGSISASKSQHHGDFDDDEATVKPRLHESWVYRQSRRDSYSFTGLRLRCVKVGSAQRLALDDLTRRNGEALTS